MTGAAHALVVGWPGEASPATTILTLTTGIVSLAFLIIILLLHVLERTQRHSAWMGKWGVRWRTGWAG